MIIDTEKNACNYILLKSTPKKKKNALPALVSFQTTWGEGYDSDNHNHPYEQEIRTHILANIKYY